MWPIPSISGAHAHAYAHARVANALRRGLYSTLVPFISLVVHISYIYIYYDSSAIRKLIIISPS